MKKTKQLRNRCWIDIDGKKFFGPGRVQLLALIEKNGSIAKAAKEMGMSYKKAWAMIDDLNERGQQPYVTLHKGGTTGGGAELTVNGKKVLTAFETLIHHVEATIEEHQAELLKLI
ncbi:winged helix-turn-helix domain-containing protein [Flagellimonas amoyensis]|uniref:winged helix-turn-helix domain-containing protein n=1 Tax=Flagellimonas amoyensis TaxID=2169401 RepID=UPI000D3749B0|nr:winged helix-turn-helix domain-containing protein [Allomuricauda amoyensis]